MRDKRVGDSQSGDPIWLVTFGDTMSLLLTFFVLLFAASDQAQMKEMLGYLSGSLGLMEYAKPSIVPPLVKRLDRRSASEKIRDFIRQQGLEESQAKITILPEGILISLGSPLLFGIGQADLKKETIPILDKIVDIVGSMPNDINIGGHTDNAPIHTRDFSSNWELSAARAIAVGNYLMKKGVDPSRLSVAGYADSRPLLPNDREENRALNRRVEILIRNTAPANSS